MNHVLGPMDIEILLSVCPLTSLRPLRLLRRLRLRRLRLQEPPRPFLFSPRRTGREKSGEKPVRVLFLPRTLQGTGTHTRTRARFYLCLGRELLLFMVPSIWQIFLLLLQPRRPHQGPRGVIGTDFQMCFASSDSAQWTHDVRSLVCACV